MAHATNTPALAIRLAVLADAPQLAPLTAQLGYASTADQVAARLGEILQDANHGVFVAEIGSRIVGYVEVFPFCVVAANARVEIGSLVVDESSRSQGVGRSLMERAEEWARARGYKEAGVRSNVIRGRAHSFYESLGYRINKTQKSFRKAL
ncbi:MAG TPA: GNAT family N-acetyltransferase [Candidatus Acidoferrales bacterium]|nr:GNAT family N-acetyltransferase [Candidatus Acidoferrales bacterium]